MFTSIIQTVLLHHVGKYLSGLEKNSFNVGLIDGQITIENIGLNNTLFDELEIPLTLKFSNIQKIHIEVPWTKLDEKATIVRIEGIDILLDLSELKSLTESSIAFKFLQIITRIRKDLEAKQQSKDKPDKKSKKEESFAQKSLIRILDNLDVTLKNLHIRFEDNSSFGTHHFSFGLILKEMNFHTANADGNKTFYRRSFSKKPNNPPLLKELKATEIEAYWNSNQTVFIKDLIREQMPKSQILHFMKLPFPNAKEEAAKSTASSAKKQADFFKDLFKTRDQKQKQKEKQGKQKAMTPMYQQMMSQMKFNPIVKLMISAYVTQNDFGKKDKPLIETVLEIQPVRVDVQEIMMSQLLCLLQYYLKYTQDLFYFQNKTKVGGMEMETQHKKRFNEVMQHIFKDKVKVKTLEDVPKQCFKTNQDKVLFESILNMQSVKGLIGFADKFVAEMRLKKQIQKAERNIKKKQKASEQIQKLMEKTGNKEDEGDLEFDETGRVLLSLTCELGGVSITVNEHKNQNLVDSIRLSIPLSEFKLAFANENNIQASLTSNDLFLLYSSNHQNFDLHQNQMKGGAEHFFTAQFKKKGKSMTLNSKMIKKCFSLPQNLIAFVMKFIQPIHITPFFLNLFQQSTNIDTEVAQKTIGSIMDTIPNMTLNIDLQLPKVELKLNHTGVIIDLGQVTTRLLQEGNHQLPIYLKGSHIQLLSGDSRIMLLPELKVQIKLTRQSIQADHVDKITIDFDQVCVRVPEVDIFDRLATEIFELTKDILTKDSTLIDRNRLKLAEPVHLNSNLLPQSLYLMGQILQLSSTSSQPVQIVIYQTNVYPLKHLDKYYVVMLKGCRVNYIQVENEETMRELTDRLIEHIQSLSTVDQLKNIWQINSKYQTNHMSVSTDMDKFMTFVCESEASIFSQKQIQVTVRVQQFRANFADITFQAKTINYQHSQSSLKAVNSLSVKSVEVVINGEKLLYVLGDQQNLIELVVTKVISEKIDLNVQGIRLSITNQSLSPLLQSVSKILKTTILREALTFDNALPKVETYRQIFNLLSLETIVRINRLECSIMDCAGFTSQNIVLRIRTEDNSQEVLANVAGMDVFQIVKFTDLELKRTVMSKNQNSLDVKYKSLLVQISPELLLRYLTIVESNKECILSHYETIMSLVDFAQSTTYLSVPQSSNEKVNLLCSNTELHLVQSQQNIVVVSIHEGMIQLHHLNKVTSYTFSMMETSVVQQRPQFSTPIVKNFSIILKSNEKKSSNSISLAITRLEIHLGIHILEFLYGVTKALHSVFLRNQWIIKFVAYFLKKQIRKTQQNVLTHQLSLNLQVDEVAVVYVRDDSVPFVKFKVKVNQSFVEIGQSINVLLGMEASLQCFNNHIKIFQPLLQPVSFDISYNKTPRMDTLKVNFRNLKLSVSTEAIMQSLASYHEIQEFQRKHIDSFSEMVSTIERINQNKTLMIQKEQNRVRSRSKIKQDFTKGFAIRTFGELKNVEPTNTLKIVNLTGVTIRIQLKGNDTHIQSTLLNRQDHIIPVKIKNQYRFNYQILERVQFFKFKLEIDGQVYENKFTLAKMLDCKVQLPEGKEIRLRAVLETEGMTILIASRMKIINDTPQKFIVKVGVNFTEEVKEHSECYLPYYIDDTFKIGMLSSSSSVVTIPQKESIQELEFVTFNEDYYTILLTTEVKEMEYTFRLTDSVRIFNHFDVHLQIRLGDTGFTLTPNRWTSMSKTSLKEIKDLQISIPTVGKWISVLISKLSENQKQLVYPLEKDEIKIYITMSRSKIGRLIHIYPRLVISNQTPYKLTLYASLYGSLFAVNKKLKDNVQEQPTVHVGFAIDFAAQNQYFILDEQRYLHLAFSHKKHTSQQFVGYESDFNSTIRLSDQTHDYHFKISYDQLRLSQTITIFKTTIKPKYYFVNKSDHDICVYETEIKSHHLVAFPFPCNTLLLNLSLDYEGVKYKLINAVELQTNNRWGLLLVEHEREDKDDMSIYQDYQVLRFGIELIFKDGFGYFVFSSNSDYVVLSNTMLDKSLRVVDDLGIKIKYLLLPNQKKNYYLLSPTINIQILGGENEIVEEVDLNTIQIVNEQVQSCCITEYFENSGRVIVFASSEQESVEFFSQDHGKPSRMVTIVINELSISFVFQTFQGVRSEILYQKNTGIQALLIDYDKIQMVQFKCKTSTLISKQLNEITEILHQQKQDRQFVNLYLELPRQPNTILKLKLDVSQVKLCVSDELMELVLLNVDRLGLFRIQEDQIMRKSRQFQSFFAFYNKTRQDKVDGKVLWKVHNLEICEVSLQIEIKKCHIRGHKNRLKSFGFSLAELKASGLKLSRLQINNSEHTPSEFFKAISNSYKRQIVGLVGGVLGGLSILGNPKEFVLEIQTSVRQSNPGIIRGTGGFFKGMAVGAVNSVSKITGVVGNGLNVLSLDQRYMEQRQQIKNRSISSLKEGFSAGASSLYKGLESGITGLVTQPARGLEQQGVLGIFKGSFKGVVGLFTKPFIGIIDAASMTTGGLAMTGKSSHHQQTTHQRIRPLYFQRNIMRPQCDVEETCCLFLSKYMPQFYKQVKLIQTFLLQQESDPETLTSILVLSLEQLMVVDILSKEVTMRLLNHQLRAVGKFSEGVVLYYMDKQNEELETILRLKRSSELKHLLYLSVFKVIQTFGPKDD